ncbi:hypothetical protein FEF33_14195 (plasmid) [Moraxella osloensis]|nr:hypothetical protein FEF33_14195 [Moraxella osloensis]
MSLFDKLDDELDIEAPPNLSNTAPPKPNSDNVVTKITHGFEGFTESNVATLASHSATPTFINDVQIVESKHGLSGNPVALDGLSDAQIKQHQESFVLDDKSAQLPLKAGQTLHAIKPDEVYYYYLKYITQLTQSITLNQLTIANNKLLYPDFKHPPAKLNQHLPLSVLTLDDYYVPNFDALYRNCINTAIVDAVVRRYTGLYLDPSNITPAYQVGVEMVSNISSLTQSKQFIQNTAWTYFALSMNNIFDWQRKNRLAYLFSFWQKCVMATIDADQQETLLEALKNQANNLRELTDKIVFDRKSLIKDRKTYNAKEIYYESNGVLTLFEAQPYTNPIGGNVLIPTKLLLTTVNYLVYEGLLDRHILSQVDNNGKEYLIVNRLAEYATEDKRYYEFLLPAFDALIKSFLPDNKDPYQANLIKGLGYSAIQEHRQFYSATSLNILPD